MIFSRIALGGLILTLSACISLIGCANYQSGNPDSSIKKQDIGMIAGALGGAFAGQNLGKGKGQTLGIAAGTLLGAFIGKEIGASLDRADMTYHNQAYQQALESNKVGVPSTWSNPDSGHQGIVTPTRTFQNNEGVYCREFSQKIVVGGQEEKAFGTACRQPDGTWKIQG